MKTISCALRLGTIGLLCLTTTQSIAADAMTTAVNAKTMSGYQRTRLKNGKFKPEYYALSNGGAFPGTLPEGQKENPIFPTVANAVGQALAKQNYFLAKDSASADLLLVVYWGRTLPFADLASRDALVRGAGAGGTLLRAQQAAGAAKNNSESQDFSEAVSVAELGPEGRAALAEFEHTLFEGAAADENRRRMLHNTAQVLGFDQELDPLQEEGRFGVRDDVARQIQSDIEDQRFYVVIMAHDFKEVMKTKATNKPVWVARTSIRARKTKFDDALAAMLASASRHLGQDTGRLIRGLEKGRVEIGEATVIGEAPPTTKAAPAETKR